LPKGEMFDQQLANFFGFIVQNPVGGIFECDQTIILTQIEADWNHFIADMGVLLPPQDERRHLDF